MSQDVFVTRAAHHFEGAQMPIAEGDWRALIENDPDLWSPDTAVPSFARWAGPSSVDRPWIDWAGGNLFTRNPDDSFLRKLLDIAGLLGATVQAADGSRFRLERDRVIRTEAAPDDPVADGAPGSVGTTPKIAAPEGPGREALPERLRTRSAPAPAFGPAPAPPQAAPRPVESRPQVRATDASDASFAVPPDEVPAEDLGGGPSPRPAPFKVGQRVRTSWGRPATVVDVDPRVDSGIGYIEIKYDDGRTASMSCIAHGLEPM